MGSADTQEAHAMTDRLHLWVRYEGPDPSSEGPPRPRFRWTAEALQPEVLGSYASGTLYGRPGTDATSIDALAAIASALANAAEGVSSRHVLLGDCPAWLTQIARQNIAELRATATLVGSTPETALPPVLGSPEARLLAVEVARDVLRGAHDLLAEDPGNLEYVVAALDLVGRTDPEVVVLPHPADPSGSPRYEGRAAEAHRVLEPGAYPARNTFDDSAVVVIVGETPFSDSGRASAAFPSETGEPTAGPGTQAHRADRESRSSRAPFQPTDVASPTRGSDPPGPHLGR